ncbi:MAG TPA: hypothetical protein VMC80_00635, partial [Patescibacteria group bacterium]|nr:hypothetical protein [Patescibacteria group bacterium]
AISTQSAGNTVVNFLLKSLQVEGVTLTTVTEDPASGVYIVNFDYSGNKTASLQVTKDGKYIDLGGQLVNMASYASYLNSKSSSSTTQTTNVPKTDKPTVELFVMSYCPYGTQMEKAIIPVLNLLKDKVNFTLRFVSYSMHGQKEVDENTRQYCIQKEQSDKFIPYLSCFLQAGDSASCLTSIGIDQSKLSSCVSSANAQFSITKTADATVASGSYPSFDIDKTLNQQYGVQGSPTLVINGVQTEPSARSPEAVLTTICSSFSTAPNECSQTLSTSQTSPGFGTGTSSSSSSSCATA